MLSDRPAPPVPPPDPLVVEALPVPPPEPEPAPDAAPLLPFLAFHPGAPCDGACAPACQGALDSERTRRQALEAELHALRARGGAAASAEVYADWVTALGDVPAPDSAFTTGWAVRSTLADAERARWAARHAVQQTEIAQLREELAEALAAANTAPLADVAAVLQAGTAFAESLLDYPALLEVIAREVAAACGGSCGLRLLEAGMLRGVAAFHPEDRVRTALAALQDATAAPERVGYWRPLLDATGPRVEHWDFTAGPPAQSDAAQVAYIRATDMRYGLAATLVAHGEVLGALGLGRYGPTAQPFDERDAALVGLLADSAAQALANARAYRRVVSAKHLLLAELQGPRGPHVHPVDHAPPGGPALRLVS